MEVTKVEFERNINSHFLISYTYIIIKCHIRENRKEKHYLFEWPLLTQSKLKTFLHDLIALIVFAHFDFVRKNSNWKMF